MTSTANAASAHSPAFDTLSTLLHSRYSCRAFAPEPLPRSTIETIPGPPRSARHRGATRSRGSSTIASGATLARSRSALQSHICSLRHPSLTLPWPREYRGVYQERRRECGWACTSSWALPRATAPRRQAAQNFTMFGAPHVAIVTGDEALGVYGAVDCGAYVSNFMLAAHSLGRGLHRAGRAGLLPRRAARGAGHWRGPQHQVCGISFGMADPAHPANHFRTTRRPGQQRGVEGTETPRGGT